MVVQREGRRVGLGAVLAPVVWLSEKGEGLALAFRLKQEGHQVDAWVKSPQGRLLFRGLLKSHDSLSDVLATVRPSSIVVFDGAGGGRTADRFRRQSVRVVGSSTLADRLHQDASSGIELMQRAGLSVPTSVEFDSFEQARKFLGDSHKVWMFQPVRRGVGPHVPIDAMKAEDMIAMLTFFEGQINSNDHRRFLLQEVPNGIEMAVEGWFDGRRWRMPFNYAMCQKRLGVGDVGPRMDVGCLSWSAHSVSSLIDQTLIKLTTSLTDNFVGAFSVDCIVQEGRVDCVRLRPGFRYDTIFAWMEMLDGPFGHVLQNLTGENGGTSETESLPLSLDDFALSVNLVNLRSQSDDKLLVGLPIHGVSRSLLRHTWFGDMMLSASNDPVTAGVHPRALTLTARGTLAEGRHTLRTYLQTVKLLGAYHRADIASQAEQKIQGLQAWLEPLAEVPRASVSQ